MSASPAPSAALLPAVFKLLRLRWLLFLNGFRYARTHSKVLTVIFGLGAAALLIFLFGICWSLLALLRSPRAAQFVGEVTPFLASLPVLILEAAFAGIFLTSFGVLLQALYLAGDMDLLLSTPVPLRAVFIAKLLEAILPNLALFGLFAVPVLFGLGAAAGYHLVYYPLVLVVIAALAIAGAGLAAMAVMLVVRIFPARRTAEVLGFLGVVFSILCSQSFQLANMSGVSRGQYRDAFQLLDRLDTPWLPLAWAGRGLVDLGEGRWIEGALQTVVLLALCGGIALASLATVERLYYAGWAGMQNHPRSRKAAAGGAARRPLGLGRLLPQAMWAVVLKDWLTLRRDLHNMSQLVTPLVIGAVYTFMLARERAGPTLRPGGPALGLFERWNSLVAYGNIAIALFVGWTLVGRLASMGIAQEGKSYWILQAAPVRPSELLGAKFTTAFLPGLVVGWLLLLLVSLMQQVPFEIVWFSFVVVALCLAGTTGINLAFGVTGANLQWSDPRQMIRTSSGCLGTVASLLFLAVCLFFFLAPPFFAGLTGLPALAGQFGGLVLGGLFSLACALVPLRLVRGELARLGDEKT